LHGPGLRPDQPGRGPRRQVRQARGPHDARRQGRQGGGAMSPRRRSQAGFTLLEVMIALAILASALTVLVRSVGRNVGVAQEAESLTVVTSLALTKRADLEESLIKDGFLETDQSSEGDFGDDGWADITWKAK